MKVKKSLNKQKFFLGLTLLFAIFALSAQGILTTAAQQEGYELPERKIICKATLEDNYTEDAIILTLTSESSRRFHNYNVESFPGIDCIEVQDLTGDTVECVQQQIKKQKLDNDMLVDLSAFRRILCLKIRDSSKEKILQTIRHLEKTRNDILAAEPNYIFSTCVTESNDPLYNDFHPQGEGAQWGLNGTNGIKAPEAWDITTGSAEIVVGVLDTGIDGAHEDLTNRIHRDIQNPLHRDFTDNNFPNGKPELEPTASSIHGTHVSGIIAGQGNNNIGISGVCWDVRLVSLKVFDGSEHGEYRWITHAVNYAASIDIPILNFSGGGYNNNAIEFPALKTAISSYTGLFVCAAGNGGNYGNDNDIISFYPANFGFDNMISVGATEIWGERGRFPHFTWLYDQGFCNGSNYGLLSVDLFAPGTAILSTIPDNGYDYMTGSSMAAPFVTGVAALMLSVNPNLTAAKIKAIILDNVDATSELTGLCVTGGQLNAYKALFSVAYIQIDDAYYSLDGSNVILVSYDDNGTTFTIPQAVMIDGINRDVTGVSNYAFANCTNLTSVIIPSSVASIGFGAFANCNNLESITIPFIGNTFNGTDNTYFGYIFGVINDCLPASLKTVTIAGGDVANQAFQACTDITSVIMLEGVTSIGQAAFYYCISLTSVTIPSSVRSIDANAFMDCQSLGSITISDNVLLIEITLLYYCNEVTVYAETESKPDGWNYFWNIIAFTYDLSYHPIIWGCTLSEDKTYVVSIGGGVIENPNGYELNPPCREGCVFGGWSLTENGTVADYDMMDFENASSTLYAIWIAI